MSISSQIIQPNPETKSTIPNLETINRTKRKYKIKRFFHHNTFLHKKENKSKESGRVLKQIQKQ